ncbi:type 4a pilus biogenesis protein PilO [Alishewanella sp. 16-MA]|uniref:Type 4a pilus biogenesis protein PilO n=1 Tax=Alishewanella maricola TaxID=2795740 RepID=A0ABS8C3U3_9ALTE|nr:MULTISPECIES: type 4a pilus biogenesis protein PilO [Alishewanella]MDP4944581.1 type 4a pilus biogenesis protein PilO [Alishewanella sp.]MCB5226998.1 type 4a pilus biogenesis protein PilO [Alishewanella maricola]MDP5035234.1 type 4a pilus biogenesis protein PilO [Alishewanella sp.]MDP5186245.1 type 4a pilus biogenesis protein PilO [Alishewanella sp.]MDP5459519.1 type 4a pilus biogenesis protein PilO [Alishewanella sp. SMS8]
MSLNMKLSDIDVNDLDLDNMGSWPVLVKVIFAAILAALVSVISYYLLIDSKIDELASAKQKETELMQLYQTRYAVAVNLEAYREQMKEMQDSLAFLLKQLPTTSETPGLLDDITYVGTTSGLVFSKINWEPEVEKEFYTELPIKIDVTGDYHQFGNFVSEVAKLPRIVSLHDFNIQAEKDGKLRFNVVAKTYRYKENSQ